MNEHWHGRFYGVYFPTIKKSKYFSKRRIYSAGFNLMNLNICKVNAIMHTLRFIQSPLRFVAYIHAVVTLSAIHRKTFCV